MLRSSGSIVVDDSKDRVATMKTDSIPALIGVTSVLIVLGFAPGVVEAGANQWHSLGPDGGEVSTLVVNPFNPLELYAGSLLDVFRTTDGGLTWHRRSRGLEGLILQILIDPQQPHRLVARTQQGWARKLFVTDNSGVEWRPVDLGSAEPSGRLYASSEDFVLFIARVEAGAMLTSLDRGETWSETDLPSGARLRAVHPGNPSRFLVRNEDDLAITANGGTSWRICGETSSTNLRDADFGPHDENTIFITTYSDGLMVSEDGCKSWNVRSGPENSSLFSVSFDPIRKDTVYSSTFEQLFRSTNGGLTWVEFGPENTRVNVWAMAFTERHQGMMYLAALGDDEKRGVMFSGDSGASWQLRMGEFRTQRVWNLLIHPDDPDHLIAGIHQRATYQGDGLYRSVDHGLSWTFIAGTEKFGPAVARDPSAPEILYTTSSERAIMRSADGGVSWTEIGPGPNEYLVVIEVDPFRSSTLFATDMIYGDAFRSDDGGRSWMPLEVVLGSDQQYTSSIRLDWYTANVVYAGLWGGGVVRSSDRGHSWQGGRQGLETNGVCDFFYCGEYWTIWDIAIDPFDPSRVFGLSSIGPFRSTDAGETWQLVREGLKVCCQLDGSWSEEGCPGYQGKGPSKLSYSFPPICLGSPDSIAFDPTDSNVVYLTADGATYRSEDGGMTWQRIDNGVGGAFAYDIHVVQDGVLLGGSWTTGVVRFDVEEIPAPRNGGGRSGQP